MIKIWILCLGICACSFAKEPLNAIIFLGSSEKVLRTPQEAYEGTVSKGVALFEKNPGFLKEIQKAYIGKLPDDKVLDLIKQDVCDFYEDKNQPFAVVRIPKQDLSRGILQVVVEEAKLGEIHAQGNCHFAGGELMDYIRSKPGEPVVMQDVLQDIAWMNQNPFRKTDAIFVPGKNPGTADLELVTTDRWPYRVYMGADNTGTISTARDRLFFGFDFGKTIIRDSQVSYQFSFSPNWNRFFAHTVSARIPCPWRHVVILYGGYAQVQPSLKDGKEQGTSWQVDGRYRIPVGGNDSLLQEVVIGYDFKETQDWVKKDHRKIFEAVADINQFMLGYELGYRTKHLKTTLLAEVYGNPGGITNKNTTREYRALCIASQSQYAYLKVSHSLAKRIPQGFWVSYDLSGQISSTNLLPSEQFTLTGYGAVRGFEERIVNVNNAILLNLTIETPRFSIAKWIAKTKYKEDELYFLAFFDCGAGHYCRDTETKSLGSIGPGIRYQYSRYVTARLDYGYQLWHSGFENATHSRYNFGLIVSY